MHRFGMVPTPEHASAQGHTLHTHGFNAPHNPWALNTPRPLFLSIVPHARAPSSNHTLVPPSPPGPCPHTLRPDAIDPALRRPGRFDREVYFGLPTAADRQAILQVLTRRWKPAPERALLQRLAAATEGFAGGWVIDRKLVPWCQQPLMVVSLLALHSPNGRSLPLFLNDFLILVLAVVRNLLGCRPCLSGFHLVNAAWMSAFQRLSTSAPVRLLADAPTLPCHACRSGLACPVLFHRAFSRAPRGARRA